MRKYSGLSVVSKGFITLFFAVIFSVCVSATSVNAEQIDSFNSKLQVQSDGALNVTETIVYNPEGVDRHGILRNVPLQNAQGRTMKVSNVTVTNERGVPYNFVQSGFGSMDLKIGDPDNTFTTPNTYVISYTLSGAYSYFDNYDEIYWNVTGNGWGFPIISASSEIDLPSGVRATQEACYYGVAGSVSGCTNSLSSSQEGSVNIFQAPGKLIAGEGLTVAVGFPKGVIPLEDNTVKAQNLIWPYLWIFTFLIIPLPTFFFLLRSWLKKGRAPKGTGVIIPQYEAPNGLTPIEVVGALKDSVSSKAISAEIVYLATKGFVKITQTEEKTFVFSNTDYELQKIKELEASYQFQDRLLMNSLFGVASLVKVSSLKNSFYEFVPAIIKTTMDGLVSKGYFHTDPKKVRSVLLLKGFFAFFGSVFLGVLLNDALSIFIGTKASAALFFGLAASGVMAIIFSLMTSARTASGVAVKEWILGFKDYLEVAEKDRIGFHNAPEKKPETFEKFLPYAMALGVEEAWAREFEGIYTSAPAWYQGPSGTVFTASLFAHNLSAFNAITASALASAPGGSGGHGSSGGGGGGGGGGGW